MCQAFTTEYALALYWLEKKGHDRCAEKNEFSYWCEVCDFQKRYLKYKKPRRVDPDRYGYYDL